MYLILHNTHAENSTCIYVYLSIYIYMHENMHRNFLKWTEENVSSAVSGKGKGFLLYTFSSEVTN